MTQLGLNNSGCSLSFIVTWVAIILAKSLHAAARILSLYCVYWNRKFVLNSYFAVQKISCGRKILLSWKFQCGIRKFQMTVANVFPQRNNHWLLSCHTFMASQHFMMPQKKKQQKQKQKNPQQQQQKTLLPAVQNIMWAICKRTVLTVFQMVDQILYRMWNTKVSHKWWVFSIILCALGMGVQRFGLPRSRWVKRNCLGPRIKCVMLLTYISNNTFSF